MMTRFRSRFSRGGALALAAAGTVHFLFSVLIWGLFIYADVRQHLRLRAILLAGAVPAFLLLAWFAVATALAWRRRRAAAWLIVIGLAASAALFWHDAAMRNWQMHMEDYHATGHQKTFYHFTWWWYDESWFQGSGRR